jgi:hypothetical protein
MVSAQRLAEVWNLKFDVNIMSVQVATLVVEWWIYRFRVGKLVRSNLSQVK